MKVKIKVKKNEFPAYPVNKQKPWTDLALLSLLTTDVIQKKDENQIRFLSSFTRLPLFQFLILLLLLLPLCSSTLHAPLFICRFSRASLLSLALLSSLLTWSPLFDFVSYVSLIASSLRLICSLSLSPPPLYLFHIFSVAFCIFSSHYYFIFPFLLFILS